jgi:hypothetical protein
MYKKRVYSIVLLWLYFEIFDVNLKSQNCFEIKNIISKMTNCKHP